MHRDYFGICLHEAAHAVVGLKIVGRPTTLTVRINEDGSGLCEREGGPLWSMAEDILWIASGGIAARMAGLPPGDDDDQRRLNEIRQRFTSPGAYRAGLRMAEETVLLYSTEIIKLATYMAERSPNVFRWGPAVN